MSRSPSLERAWQGMRFIAQDMPGPLVQPYVKALEALEVESENIPSSEAAQLVFEAGLDRRAQRILAECILAKPSLG